MSALREAGLAVNRALESARPIEAPQFSARESCGRHETASPLGALSPQTSGDSLQESYILPPLPGILDLNWYDLPSCGRSQYPN